jgi:hypothetical protein
MVNELTSGKTLQLKTIWMKPKQVASSRRAGVASIAVLLDDDPVSFLPLARVDGVAAGRHFFVVYFLDRMYILLPKVD